MSAEEIAVFAITPLTVIPMGIGTFVIIHLDERPKKKRKR